MVEQVKLALSQSLPLIHGSGGTGVGGYEPLKQVEAPYLKSAPLKGYTLVLDLDETLVHYYENSKGEGNFRVRPGCESFLKEMAKFYELVIFTAAMQDYADWVLNQLDPQKWIAHRLYR